MPAVRSTRLPVPHLFMVLAIGFFAVMLVTTAYLAAEGFERELDDELARAGVAVGLHHGRLRVSESRPVHAAWAANTWWDAERIAVTSIGHAAKELRRRQRNWASTPPSTAGGRS
jgi:23S rRNA (cytidine2498-2'-O)-methyltransferase